MCWLRGWVERLGGGTHPNSDGRGPETPLSELPKVSAGHGGVELQLVNEVVDIRAVVQLGRRDKGRNPRQWGEVRGLGAGEMRRGFCVPQGGVALTAPHILVGRVNTLGAEGRINKTLDKDNFFQN